MSKVVRKKLLEVTELLKKGTERIGKLADGGRMEEGFALLADCQDLAIALGTRIEKLHGEGTGAVSALEDYCEKLYLVGETMQGGCTSGDELSGEAAGAAAGGASRDEETRAAQRVSGALRELQESLRAVCAAVETEFPDKLEIVFLPYKASMWDSLESVWMAARDDSSCETYVIPIPYYTLDEHRNFVEYFYEGEQYPDRVPITDYRSYDLKLHHPDVIYVHNPYDQFNRVTSVAPEFYLKVIKDYTEKLVYIPYFVLNEIDPSDQSAIDGMSHFCFVPGTYYADQVIVQSENMRKIYINEYIKAARKRNLKVDRAEVEKKFLGTGSPKFDKILYTRREELNIPEEWLPVLRKPDGTDKKVILYNTGVAAILTAEDKMLPKIRRAFQTFWEYRDEVALLWRPHPLIQDTLKAQHPEMLEEYREIVREYRSAAWGIYDDTADLDRAIILSDAYYGDASSVVQLCQKAGMPVMIQNVDV